MTQIHFHKSIQYWFNIQKQKYKPEIIAADLNFITWEVTVNTSGTVFVNSHYICHWQSFRKMCGGMFAFYIEGVPYAYINILVVQGKLKLMIKLIKAID